MNRLTELTFATVASGIEAPSVAWHPLGFKPVFFSEIAKFPSKVLKHHYPGVPNLGDMKKINGYEYRGTIDIFFGGTPCQSFSVAGDRGGLIDPRGNLTFQFLRLVDEIRPKWFIWENVPGVLSSNKGRDFGAILGKVAKLGYGFAYRVLDAQYFGVPQRRRRLFLIGYIGGQFQYPASVLFEPESLCGNFEAGRTKKPTVAALTASGVGTCGADDNQAQAGHLIEWPSNVAGTLTARYSRSQGTDDQHVKNGCSLFVPGVFPSNQITSKVNRSTVQTDKCHTLTASDIPAVFNMRGREGGNMPELNKNNLASIRASRGGSTNSMLCYEGVRRLTPVECERLQGFPDNYTKISNKTADAPRYHAIGNSVPVPFLDWIGRRIQMISELT